MNPQTRPWVLASVLALSCNGERWLLESEFRPDAGLQELDAAVAVACPDEPEPFLLPTVQAAAPQLGTWSAATGSLIAMSAVLPATRLELLVNEREVSLVLRSAQDTLPPPQADGGYLCPAEGPSSCSSPSGLIASHTYRAIAISSRNAVLHLSFSLDQPWDAWCALQTPVARTALPNCPPEYRPEAPYSEPLWQDACTVRRNEQRVPIDCERLTTLDRNPCTCSSTACWASTRRTLDLNLRYTANDRLEGTLWLQGNQAIDLALERQP